MRIVLIGGNPKGHCIPFHPSTLSGRRLRDILSKLKFSFEIDDMTVNSNDIPNLEEIDILKNKYSNHKVVFLGRFVERILKKHFPNGIYLPHPASRRKSDLEKLELGLAEIATKADEK